MGNLFRSVFVNATDEVVTLSAGEWTKITVPENTKTILLRNQGVNNDGDTPVRIYFKFTSTQPTDTSRCGILDLKEWISHDVLNPDIYVYSDTDGASLYVLRAE